MRRTIHVVVLAMIAGLLSALIGTPISATSLANGIPYAGTETGNFSTVPTGYTNGQAIQLSGNFDANIGINDVTFYEESSVGSNDYEVAGTDEANTQGNAYLSGFVVHDGRKVFAKVAEGPHVDEVTEVYTQAAQAEPSCIDDGNLSTTPTIIAEGQTVKISANFPNAQALKQVTFFKKDGTNSVSIGTDESNSSGNAYLNYQVDATQEVYARSSDNHCTETATLTPVAINPESFPQTGALATSPTTFYDGRSITVNANFPSGTVGITLFKETDPGVWTAVAQKTSNSSGDASFSSYQVNGTHKLFALTSTGNRTEVDTLTPKAPNDVTGGPSTLGNRVIYVTTNNGGTPTTKGVDYEAKTVLVEGGAETETLDLETIAVRGNSTADKPKKPYKFKFEDKQSPFGMPEDKTWVLLANYLDWTLVRSMVAWDLGSIFDTPAALKWYPRSQFTELFINGKYMGSYQLVESIKISDDRVNVKPKWGTVIENDPHWATDGVPGFKGVSGMNYAWKDPDEFKFFDPEECAEEEAEPDCVDPEGLTIEKIDKMKDKIKAFETVLYGANGTKDWSKVPDFDTLPAAEDWTSYLDMDSAVDYYLTREFTKDNDADFFRSNFFHINDVRANWAVFPIIDKFFMGPIWDFDRSAGANTKSGTSNPLPTGWWIRGDGSPTHDTNKIHWFTRITKDPRFLNRLHDRWAEVRDEMAATFVGDGVARGPAVSRAVTKLGGTTSYDLGRQVAANDRARWPDHSSRFDQRASTYSGELTWLRNWYKDRFVWMDNELKKTPPPIP